MGAPQLRAMLSEAALASSQAGLYHQHDISTPAFRFRHGASNVLSLSVFLDLPPCHFPATSYESHKLGAFRIYGMNAIVNGLPQNHQQHACVPPGLKNTVGAERKQIYILCCQSCLLN